MFEKVAEEIAKDIYIHHFDDDVNYPDVLKAITVGVQKGAEHGYNKANEWYYVKDGLPEELHDVLCFVIHKEHRYFLQGYLRDGRWVLSPLGTYLNNEDVIAWKEIVLPKETENA